MIKNCMYMVPVVAVILLSACTGNPQDIQTAPQTTVSQKTSESASTDEYPILGSTLDGWTKKYGQPQGENLVRFEQDYILVKFFDKPEAYDIFLQFVYLDQKRRTSIEADSVVKQFLPKDSIIKEKGKKESVDETGRYFIQIDIYDSPSLKAVFGDGHVEVRKTVWTDSDPKPGISDIQLTYLTNEDIELMEEMSNESDNVDQNESNLENEELNELMDSLLQANREQLMHHRDNLDTIYRAIVDKYNKLKANYNTSEWSTFVKHTQDDINKHRDEFIKVFVDVRLIPSEHIKFALPIAELFAKLKQDLIIEMGKDLDGKTNELPQITKEIENLFHTLMDDGL
ncbi:hypothetical protein [Paenibacillus prosopidis]|uniref:Lipoprotein n=1 Tax=Paenibacillus prosopidis TaxID=630520 RepID=A0A368VFN6_9BACL|nr:hypothetical protein [Paenibacillus prosopidis]RCW40100.1 hypothetical protein DFP97_1412 [Paenibacillus prosopidis]